MKNQIKVIFLLSVFCCFSSHVVFAQGKSGLANPKGHFGKLPKPGKHPLVRGYDGEVRPAGGVVKASDAISKIQQGKNADGSEIKSKIDAGHAGPKKH